MKFFSICATFLLLAASLFGADARAAPSGIEAALSRGDGPGAEELVRAALAQSLSPLEKARLLTDLASARALQGANDDALAIFTQVIDSRVLPTPEQARALLERGMALDALNRTYDAVGDFSVALSLAPELLQARRSRADAYLRLDRFDLARADYLAALKAHDPHPAGCYYGLGQIAEVQGDKAAARRYYAKAVAADPVYADAVAWLTSPGHGALTLHPPGVSAGTMGADRPVLKPPSAPPRPAAAPAHEKKHEDRLGLRPAIGSGSQAEIQLGAWRSADAANLAWKHAMRLAGGDLAGFTPYIQVADLPGKGRYYRLRIGLASRDGARRLCDRLLGKKIDCAVVRG